MKKKLRSATLGFFTTIMMAIVILAIGAGYGRYQFGSIAAALAYVEGERLIIDSRTKEVGDIPADTTITVDFLLTNLTGRSIQLLGSRTSCSCTMVGDLPMQLAAGETGTIRVKVAVSDEPPNFAGSVDLFTDDPRYRTLKLAYTGHAVDPRGMPEGQLH